MFNIDTDQSTYRENYFTLEIHCVFPHATQVHKGSKDCHLNT